MTSDELLAALYEHWMRRPQDWRTDWGWWHGFELLMLTLQAEVEARESYAD